MFLSFFPNEELQVNELPIRASGRMIINETAIQRGIMNSQCPKQEPGNVLARQRYYELTLKPAIQRGSHNMAHADD